jgi:uncharacterized protein YndB with AHSA1/START domain
MTPPDPDRRSMSLEVEVPGTPEEVWHAIATGPGISAWFVPTEVDEREGGGAVFHLGPGMDAPATVTGWQPPGRFAYEEPWPAEDGAEPATLATEFLVEARDGGTCVVRVVSTFSAPGFDGALDDMGSGWKGFLDTLRIYLAHFAGQPAETVVAQAVSPAPREATWDEVRAALGLTGAEAGRRVATDAGAGVPSLEGVLERVSEEDLLIRTADALATLGVFEWNGMVMTVFRESCFGPDARAAAERDQAAWSAWMEERFPTPAVAADAPGG